MSESDQPLAWRLRSIVGEENVLADEPMSEHTTFKVGGPADLFVTPEDPDEVREVLLACDEAGVSRFVMGRGSDLLVSDDGYRGVIVSLAECLVGVSMDGTEMTCQAGVDLREASEMACELGLSGLEFACGIPGSIGGACFMNAGAYGGCVADVLKSVRVLLPDGSQETIGVDDLNTWATAAAAWRRTASWCFRRRSPLRRAIRRRFVPRWTTSCGNARRSSRWRWRARGARSSALRATLPAS